LSILFRTKEWLTLAQLLPAWASELAERKKDANQIERDLGHILIEDIINDRLDDAGPLEGGRRLGLLLITPENRAGYLDGQQARELLMPAGTPAAFSFVSNRLLVLKVAVLDFARRHKLPPPSWWTDASTATKKQTGDLPELAGSFRNDFAAAGQANRGRRASGPKSIRSRASISGLTPPSPVPKNVVVFYNKRGTCEQWIKQGKGAIKWTRLSCRSFAANAVRLQLHALAYNLGNFLRTLATPEPIKD